jgi:hypothetical protein
MYGRPRSLSGPFDLIGIDQVIDTSIARFATSETANQLRAEMALALFAQTAVIVTAMYFLTRKTT